MDEQRIEWNRAPLSLNELLQMTIKLSEQEMKEFKPTFESMDEDRKAFLAGALHEHFGQENSESKKLRESTEFLAKFTADGIEDRTITEEELSQIASHFEEISYLIEDMDHAKDFTKMDGSQILVQFLKSKYSSLQWRAADGLAIMTQNNMYCQSAAVKADAIQTLLFTLASPQAVEIVCLKCVHALSQLVQNFRPGIILFMRSGGVQPVLQQGLAARDASVKMQMKAAGLLGKLLTSASDPAPEMAQLNLQMAGDLDDKNSTASSIDYIVREMTRLRVHEVAISRLMPDALTDAHELTLRLLLLLLRCDGKRSAVAAECAMPMYGLQELFKERQNLLKGSEDADVWEEVVRMYAQAASICFPPLTTAC